MIVKRGDGLASVIKYTSSRIRGGLIRSDRWSDRHGWMEEEAANGGQWQLSGFSRENSNRCTTKGIVCFCIAGSSWKSQPVRVRRYRGQPCPQLYHAPYINSPSNGFFFPSSPSLLLAAEKSYFTVSDPDYPHRESSAYTRPFHS